MKVAPVKRYNEPNIPTLLELATREKSRRPGIRSRLGTKLMLTVLIAGTSIFSGCGNSSTSQDIADFWDDVLVTLHIKQPPQRLMGDLAMPMPTPAPAPGNTNSNTDSNTNQATGDDAQPETAEE